MDFDKFIHKRLPKESQLIYRLILLFTALFYALFGILYRTVGVEDPMADEIRIIMGSLYFGFYLLTYIKFISKYLYAFVCSVSFIGVFHMGYLGFLANFSGNYAFSILVVIFLVNLIFRSGLLLRMYNIGFNLFLIVLIVMSPEAEVNRPLFDRDIWMVFKEAEEMMYSNKIKESKEVHRNIVLVLKELLEKNTTETPEHCCQVKKLAVEIGEILELSRENIEKIKQLADYHDLGKVSVVTSETGENRRGNEEKRHMEIGYQIASSRSCLTNIAEGILAHHENWDGTGKPRGLMGEDIPLIARIIAPVDHYVFLTLNKGYKKEKARQIIDDRAGNKYDPEIVDIFLNQVLD